MNIKGKINCKNVADYICENLGEGLDSEKCREIKKHLENCVDCQKYFDSVEQTIEFYKKYNVSLPKVAHERLLNILGLND